MRSLLVAAVLALTMFAGCADPLPDVPGDVSRLPDAMQGRARAPDFAGANSWLNTGGQAVSIDDLEGQVVLVDFWTYSCINCIRTMPHLTAWYDTYEDHGFTIIGVHSPEFEFEEERDNVADAIQRYGIRYPVPQDNDRNIWDAYHNRYWPAHYLLDTTGRIVDFHIGEGAYEETEMLIRQLLRDGGADGLPPRVEGEEGTGVRHADITPELYAGTWRQPDALGNEAGYDPGKEVKYSASGTPERDRIYLDGTWYNGQEAMAARSDGEVLLRFRAGAANFVADGPAGSCIEVRLDGAPIPDHLAGPDVQDGDVPCIMLAQTPRSYDFYEGPVATYEVSFTVPEGFSLYTFAFSAYDH